MLMMSLAVGFPSAKDTIHDDSVVCDFKKRTPVAGAHPIFGAVVGETFDVTFQVVFKPTKALDKALAILRRHRAEVFLGFGFELDALVHGAKADEIGLAERWEREAAWQSNLGFDAPAGASLVGFQ